MFIETYVGEIRFFAGTFAPSGWMFCDGQLLEVNQYMDLFQVIGFTYGRDGNHRFALPDLRGRAALCQGVGIGLTEYKLGDSGGETAVALSESQIPAHKHQARCTVKKAQNSSPAHALWSRSGGPDIYTDATPNTLLDISALEKTGMNQPHNNLQPYLGLNFIIAIDGEIPPRP